MIGSLGFRSAVAPALLILVASVSVAASDAGDTQYPWSADTAHVVGRALAVIPEADEQDTNLSVGGVAAGIGPAIACADFGLPSIPLPSGLAGIVSAINGSYRFEKTETTKLKFGRFEFERTTRITRIVNVDDSYEPEAASRYRPPRIEEPKIQSPLVAPKCVVEYFASHMATLDQLHTAALQQAIQRMSEPSPEHLAAIRAIRSGTIPSVTSGLLPPGTGSWQFGSPNQFRLQTTDWSRLTKMPLSLSNQTFNNSKMINQPVHLGQDTFYPFEGVYLRKDTYQATLAAHTFLEGSRGPSDWVARMGTLTSNGYKIVGSPMDCGTYVFDKQSTPPANFRLAAPVRTKSLSE